LHESFQPQELPFPVTLTELLLSDPGLNTALQYLQTGNPIRIGQVGEGLRPILVLALRQALQRPLLLVLAQAEAMERMAALFGEWNAPHQTFPALEPYFGEKAPADSIALASRLSAVWSLRQKPAPLVLTTMKALLQPCPSPTFFQQHCLALQSGQILYREELLDFLNQSGYSRTPRVEALGEYSVRGAIVDFFTPSSSIPMRLEFEGDRLDSIRTFDPTSQISETSHSQALILPWRAFQIHAEGLSVLQAAVDKQKKKLREGQHTSEARFLEETVGSDLQLLQKGVHFLGEEFYHPFFAPVASLLQHMPSDTLILGEEEGKLQPAFEENRRSSETAYRIALERGEIPPYGTVSWQVGGPDSCEVAFLPNWETLEAGMRTFDRMSLSPFGADIDLPTETLPSFQGQLSDFLPILKGWLKELRRVILAGRGLARYQDLFKSQGIPLAEYQPDAPLQPGVATLWKSPLSPGFNLPTLGVTLVSELELFGWRRRPKTERKYRQAKSLSSWEELKPGDLVVHETYGIGRYQGLATLNIDGMARDYIQICYAEEDKLYVPSEQIYLVAKYLGDHARFPSLTRLHSTDWSRTKRRVRRAVEEVAKQLLEMYAARELAKPEPFPGAEPWEEDLAMTFPYEETPDQDQAIQDVLSDLERGKAMDRLVCGDVGYGKTEVALRASFRAVLSSKQVAILAPTTILCQQHYNTFQERLRNFPMKVEMLSRFRSPREQLDILKRLEEGKIDILIGTHSLLGQRVHFRDLGLLVIDEEQRFGVMQKERIRQWKGDLHVLTLTATPIPRTLEMSLLGIREVSLIETAPVNRVPVKTYVVEADEGLIRTALIRELERGGQSFVVHNRIQGLPRLLSRLQASLPDVRIATAHGQMPEDRLEKTMWDFAQGNYDILLCTAIIESGIDLPNVNTLIVLDAQNFGLAQLYQLRGRVGRSASHAYAYFLYPKHRALPEEAEKRLEAIRDFTTLGAGLKIATRDLEIRGAGNILGEEQHGFMVTVGFQLYRQMRGEPAPMEGEEEIPPPPRATLELEVNAYIPSSYVPDEGSKMELYERLAILRTTEPLILLWQELRDRFGTIPIPVENLLRVSRVRVLAERAGISRIRLDDRLLVFSIEGEAHFDTERLVLLARRYPRRFKVREGDFYLRLEEEERAKALDQVEEILTILMEETQ
jgi:transcription-repair coupling factor (superfamily II helicase)